MCFWRNIILFFTASEQCRIPAKSAWGFFISLHLSLYRHLNVQSTLCVWMCARSENKGSQFCSSVWVPEIRFRTSGLAGRIFARWATTYLACTILLLLKTTDRAREMAQLLRAPAALRGKSWFLQHSHCGSHPSDGLFWFLWAPDMHVVDTHTRRQNTPHSPTQE